jgi:putative ABC transport system permease protein
MRSIHDLLDAARQLARRPLPLLLAVVPLGLAIAALSAVYAIAQSTLLSPLPGIDTRGGALVEIGREARMDTLSWPSFKGIEREAESFDALYAWRILPVNARNERASGTTRGLGLLVSGRYFEALGARTAHGRLLDAADETAGTAAPRVVLGQGAFQRLLDGDPARIGASVVLNGQAYTVVGVVDASFRGHIAMLEPDYYLPMTLLPLAQPADGATLLDSAQARWLHMGGRVREGVSLEAASAELAAIAPRIDGMRRSDGVLETPALAPLRGLPNDLVAPMAGFSTLLGALVLVVLLVACTNVGGWLLSRGEARLSELGIRMALGASRARILRLLLAEALVVAVLASVLAIGGVQLLLGLLPAIDLPAPFPVRFVVPLGAGVVGFALALCGLTVFAAGLLPALRVSGAAGLAGGTRATRRSRLRELLVAGQVALTTFLLVGAGLFAQALAKSQQVDIGFEPRATWNADLDLEPSGYPQDRQQQVLSALLERVRAIPGVEQAALARVVPLTLNQMSYGVVLDDGAPERAFSPSMNIVSPGYFATLGIALAGRDFADADRAGGTDVVVVNRRFAERVFGTADALDRTFRYGSPEAPRTLRVVGIVGDGRYASWHEQPEPFMWLPLAQWPAPQQNILLRSPLPHAELARAVAAAIAAVDPDLPVPQLHAMQDTIALSILPQRIAALTGGAIGALGLLLAALGLYALMAQFVAARTREIGVRLSLGATPSRMAREVAWRGARLSLLGLGLGLLAGSALAMAAQTVLFGVDAGDVVAFAGAALAIAVCALLACAGPARRAARTAPAVALRQD